MRSSIADFEVSEPWAGGGRRWVCRAPARLGRDTPVLVGELDVDAEGLGAIAERLLRLAQAGGDGLIGVIEVGPDRATGGSYLATDAVRPATPEQGGRIAAMGRVARTVHGLHEAGLAHGALRPAAVLGAGSAAVLDLPPLDDPAGRVLTVTDPSDLSTVDPDLLRGERPSRSTDIWSLGATLHRLLSPLPLHPGIQEDEPVTAVQRVLFTRPEVDPRLPAPLRRLIESCLEEDPAARPSTAAEFAERVEAVGSEVDR